MTRLAFMLVIPALLFFLGYSVGQSQLSKATVVDTVVKSLEQGSGTLLRDLTLGTPSMDQGDFDADFYTFWEVYRRLKKFHPDSSEVTDQDFLYGAVKGLTSSVGDPFTYYLTPEETDEFINVDLNGELQGIGAELKESQEGVITIVNVLPGAPAEGAGVLPGDIIYKVDGEEVINASLFEVVKKIRGEKGTTVTITFVREGVDEAFDISIVRDEIKVPSVEYKMLENENIGYIELHKFSESTEAELQKIINSILLTPPQALVLDLRDNSGGYLEASVDVVSLFVEKGKVVTVQNTKANEPFEYFARGRARLGEIPLVVLVNEQSASAAEIVAGALQDLGRAELIGMPTYGKGSVQELDTLPDGSALRITIAKWYTPNGLNVEDEREGKVGVFPDIEVERTPQDRLEGRDQQLEKALEFIKSGFSLVTN